MTFPVVLQSTLPPNTIVPESEDLFIPYLNRLYEDIAFTVNDKVNSYFQIAITDTPSNIANVTNFGSFLIMVSGGQSTFPTLIAALTKSDSTASGTVAVLGSQVGAGTWSGFGLTITSTSTNFQIAHNNTGVTGNFNIQLIGTQG